MRRFDAAVIGGGVLGCFAARSLRRWHISTVLLEAEEDVCTGVTRANAAIVYAGYDNQPGSLKAGMTVRGNARFDELCRELEVPFVRRGSLMASFGPRGDQILRKKLDQGHRNGVPGLRLLSGGEAAELEPMLAPGVTSALYAPTTGTVNPWQLGIAAYENAVRNGAEAMLNTRVLGIQKSSEGYVIETDRGPLECRVALNCAGLQADKVQELLFPPSVRLFCDGADFLVLDRGAPSPKYIIFHEPEEKGKGLTAVPTAEGNLLLGPSQRPLAVPWATTADGMDFLLRATGQVLPGVDLGQVIRSFGAVRPNPHRVVWQDGGWVPDGRSIGSFVIENPAPGFYSLIGIKTPGLTCGEELGMYLAGRAAAHLDAAPNPAFDPHRTAIARDHPDCHQIVCRCQRVTRGEILEAIARGAVTVDGVKRRVGSGMGPCQGGRCTGEIVMLLKKTGANSHPVF